jgi:hypothetical protein
MWRPVPLEISASNDGFIASALNGSPIITGLHGLQGIAANHGFRVGSLTRADLLVRKSAFGQI